MRIISFVAFTFLCSFFSAAQNLIKTRQAGWQQQVNYTISVSLDDSKHMLRATEQIVYINHSPDELKEIYIHLWPNAYRNTETAFARQQLENGSTDFYYSREEDKGWIDSLDFKVNGQRARWYLMSNIDICRIELEHPLKPGEQLEISTPFVVKIPKVFSRMGHEDQLYCITQWYPKPAVYDANGWNYFPYLDQGEFYSEFGRYDVSITVPKDYVIAATGDVQDPAEEAWWLANAKQNNVPHPAAGPEKTLRFVQDSVHDFAWFGSKSFRAAGSSVMLKSGRTVKTWLFAESKSAEAKIKGVEYVNEAVTFYSEKLGEYPYHHATAVVTPLKAGGGMEYPTITNVERIDQQVIIHEVGHNWFYGILANNERIYPWMDESFNNYYETRCLYRKKPAVHRGFIANLRLRKGASSVEAALGESPFGLLELEYLLSARRNADQPVDIPATSFEKNNYGFIIYGKGPLLFHHLQESMGDSAFDGMMQAYYEKWKFRHPLPDDYIDHVKGFTGKGQEWLFTGLMGTVEKPDYKLVSVKDNMITVKNKSAVAAPFPVSSMLHDSVLHTQWYEGFTGKKTLPFDGPTGRRLRLDAYEVTADVYRNNNTIRTRGMLKGVEPVRFSLLGDLEDPYHRQVFYSPVIGANLYNKTMLGMAFYNGLLPRKKFDYTLVPMYSFGTRDVVGYANLERHFNTYGMFRQIHLGVSGARFAYEYFTYPYTYNKVAPFLRFDLDKANKRSPVEQSIRLRSVMLFFEKNRNSSDLFYAAVPRDAHINELSYQLLNKKAVNKNALTVTVQHISDQGNSVKAFAEFKQTLNYNRPRKKLDMRLYGGTFLTSSSSLPDQYMFRTSGNTGLFDYTFDQALLGRSEGLFWDNLFARQLIEQQGNMHMPISIVNTDSWMLSANLVSTIPGPIPIRVFADLGYINQRIPLSTLSGTTVSYKPTFQYVAGLKVVVVEEIFEVNFPLFYSSDFEDALNASPSYKDAGAFKQLGRRITFTLNLNRLNPIKAVREASF